MTIWWEPDLPCCLKNGAEACCWRLAAASWPRGLGIQVQGAMGIRAGKAGSRPVRVKLDWGRWRWLGEWRRAGPVSQPHILGGYFLGSQESFTILPRFLCFPKRSLLLDISGLSSEVWEAALTLTDKGSGVFVHLEPQPTGCLARLGAF